MNEDDFSIKKDKREYYRSDYDKTYWYNIKKYDENYMFVDTKKNTPLYEYDEEMYYDEELSRLEKENKVLRKRIKEIEDQLKKQQDVIDNMTINAITEIDEVIS
jgi:ABC-type phosphate transport system auxiliary subunit